MTHSTHDAALQKTARLAGILYLAIILSSLIALAFIDPQIYVKGDPAATIDQIIKKEFLFRLDTTITLVMFIAVVILALTLYKILRPANSELAKAALLFRVGEGFVGILAVLGNLAVLLLLKNDSVSAGFTTEQIHQLVQTLLDFYWEATLAIFVLMGAGSVLFFYLFFLSGLLPKALSIWGMVSYALVLLGGLISLLFGGNVYMILGSQTILFELVIGCWLTFKGINSSKK